MKKNNTKHIIATIAKSQKTLNTLLEEYHTTPAVKKKVFEGEEIRFCNYCNTYNTYESDHKLAKLQGKEVYESIFHCDNCNKNNSYYHTLNGKQIINKKQ